MKNLLTLTSAAMLFALYGCGGGNNDDEDVPPPPLPAEATFEVTVTNLTNAQPLSPVALVAHDGEFRVFQIGEAASAGLEVLAEGGDNGQFLTDSEAATGVLATATGSDPVGPGATSMLSITVEESSVETLALSIATMLVNTNDAFSGVNTVSVGELAVGESMRRRGIAYDAGTEADSEAAGTIPGPAVGGEGFNELRDDDADRVSMHTGVVSNETGLMTSILDSQQRFDNPVLEFTITRTE